ncbi:unnamed protein product [Prunus armeniaca]
MKKECANELKKKGSGKKMMIKLPWQWVWSINQANTTVVHNPTMARTWTDVDTLRWKNFPTVWQGDYGNKKGQKSIILEAFASFYTWVSFFGVEGFQNYLNVLGQSQVFNDVLRGQALQMMYEINNTVY